MLPPVVWPVFLVPPVTHLLSSQSRLEARGSHVGTADGLDLLHVLVLGQHQQLKHSRQPTHWSVRITHRTPPYRQSARATEGQEEEEEKEEEEEEEE